MFGLVCGLFTWSPKNVFAQQQSPQSTPNLEQFSAQEEAASKLREEQVLQELQALSAEAVEGFVEGTAALDAKDYAKAESRFKATVQSVPGFAPALRRLCLAKVELGQGAEAISLCRQAIDKSRDTANLIALSSALARASARRSATQDEMSINEAINLAKEAMSRESSSPRTLVNFCYVAVLGHRVESARDCVRLSQEKLPIEMTASHQVGLGWAIGGADTFAHSTPEQRAEATQLAQSAAKVRPDDPAPHLLLCMLAEVGQQKNDLQQCSTTLLRLAPEDWRTHLFVVINATTQGDFEQADRAIEALKKLGAPAETIAGVERTVAEQRPGLIRRLAPWFIGVWVALLALTAMGGAVLNRLTLNAMSTVASNTAAPTLAEMRLRRAYAAVLWASCVLYYISLPLVSLLVIAMAGTLLYLMLTFGHVHIGLTLTAVILAFTTVVAIGKSLWRKGDAGDPGEPLDLTEHPAFQSLLLDLAQKIGTRPVDRVYLTPGTDLAVYERGGLWAQLRGGTERCLILGVGILKGFELDSFRAVLAHEYGHFSNQDTAGGGFALTVRRSLWTMGMGLAQSGAATWYNPAWWFFRGFAVLFTRISQGASRLQEVLADRWAVNVSGAEAFCQGLTHVIEQELRFEHHMNTSLKHCVEDEKPIRNLYSYKGAEPIAPESLAEELEKAINRDPSPYDSHPSPAQRFALARAFVSDKEQAIPPRTVEDASTEPLAWSLFANRKRLERSMTEVIYQRIEKHTGATIVRFQEESE